MSQTVEVKEYRFEEGISYEVWVPGYGEVTAGSVELPTNHISEMWCDDGLTRLEFPAGVVFSVEEGDVPRITARLE